MANVFSRSFEITKLSLAVMKEDKELILFPVLAGLFSLAFLAAMLFPTVITTFLASGKIGTGLEYVVLFITYVGLAFIATFFNVCVVYTTKTRFAGGNATFFESIGFAISRVHIIFLWSLLSATVGLILHVIENAANKSESSGAVVLGITRALLGAAWGIVTIFDVPVMVYERLGPFAAIKSSVGVLRKTWGESLVRAYGLGLAEFVFLLVGIVVTVGLVVLSGNHIGLLLLVLAVAVMYMLGVILFFSVASTIFNTALYEYASSGKLPYGYSEETLNSAINSKNLNV